MGKNKIRKKTDDEIRIIQNITNYVNEYSSKTNFVRNVDFEEIADKNSLRFEAKLDCGSFKEKIVYYPFMLFDEHCINVEFSFEESKYTYSIYDIFNLFDIDDFNLYYYKNIISLEDVKKAIKNIFEATEKYSYYIEKAKTAEYLPNLEKNYESDMNNVTGSDFWKDEEQDEDDLFLLPLNHICYSYASDQITDKLVKKMKKKSEKGKLNTIYENRLLKHLESGNEVKRNALTDEKQCSKYKRKIFVPIAGASLFVMAALVFTAYEIVFSGAMVPKQVIHIFGMDLLYLREIGITFIGALVLYLGIQLSFGKKIIYKFAPDDIKEHMSIQLDAELNGKSKPKRPLTLALSFIATLAITAGLIYFAIANIGFYDTKVKFFDDSLLGIYTVEYEDVEIYKLDQISSDDDDYFEAENAYAVSDGKGHYYELGEVEPNSNFENKLFGIAKQYDKEIIEIKSVEELK